MHITRPSYSPIFKLSNLSTFMTYRSRLQAAVDIILSLLISNLVHNDTNNHRTSVKAVRAVHNLFNRWQQRITEGLKIQNGVYMRDKLIFISYYGDLICTNMIWICSVTCYSSTLHLMSFHYLIKISGFFMAGTVILN